LLSIANSTKIPQASILAANINSSISSWNGFFYYWNPIFVVVGDFPATWTVESGSDQNLSVINSQNGTSITIKTTIFTPNPNFDFYNYTDQELYFSLWNLHVGNYSGAESTFQTANKFWDGFGFKDQAYPSDGSYTSYKLALDLIVWKALASNPNTSTFANGYLPLIKNVTSIMSQLQSSNGGVWTNYKEEGGQIITGISLWNVETTSLFVLAESD
jgi:hypothetical protein